MRGSNGGWAGILQADAFDGYNRLYLPDRKPGPIVEALCWSHARRQFFELADIAPNARRARRRRRSAKPMFSLALAMPIVRANTPSGPSAGRTHEHGRAPCLEVEDRLNAAGLPAKRVRFERGLWHLRGTFGREFCFRLRLALLDVLDRDQQLIFRECLSAATEAMAPQFLDDLDVPLRANAFGDQHHLCF
jgi:hypothetical protein